ncbi:MAG: tetratricopeptide repeat protein [candidate division NC10 bacterium]|nr:tetratricopeptide repeat protein [candidate division NC10 bacterium]
MIHDKRVVVLPAYNAARTLRRTIAEIPPGFIDRLILVDDDSSDRTVQVSRELGLRTIQHESNRGYGANQKTCYRAALEEGADVVIMLHPDAWYNAGVAYARLGDARGALASFRVALRLDPTNADGWVNLGLVHQTLAQYQQAVACYKPALRLRPEDPVAHRNLIIAYGLQGERGKALEALRRFRAIDPAGAEELRRSLGAAP